MKNQSGTRFLIALIAPSYSVNFRVLISTGRKVRRAGSAGAPRASGRRGRNAMGRFTSRSNGSYDHGYSEAADEMIGLAEEAKSCAEDEQMKQELQKLIRKAHSM